MSNTTTSTAAPTLNPFVMIGMLFGMIGKAIAYINQSMDVAGKVVNSVDQVVSQMEDHAVYYRKSGKARLEELYAIQQEDIAEATTTRQQARISRDTSEA